jgi:hypothetical protein
LDRARNVIPAALYADEIVRAMDTAKAVALFLSENAAAAPQQRPTIGDLY